MYVLIYLVAIVLANLSVAYFGPKMTIVNAFVLIGLDLTCRDYLHESWHRRGLVWKMALLILAGSGITILLNLDAMRIAIASATAFGLAAFGDFAIYSLLFKKKKIIKINGSNGVGSAIDSLAFPTIAFGSIMPFIILGQFLAKVFGGFLWSLILVRQGFKKEELP